MPRNNSKRHSKGKKDKTENRNLLGIANLILTGIIGIVIALYVNNSNQIYQRDLFDAEADLTREMAETQAASARELAELESELERNSEMAKLDILLPCQFSSPCSSPIIIRNIGLANATNVRVVISISDVTSIWLDTINDIKDFKLITFPPSRDFIVKEISADSIFDFGYDYLNIEGNNSYEVVTSSLATASQFTISLILDETLPVEIIETTREASLECSELEFCNAYDALAEYITNIHPVAYFSVYADCDNCEGTWVLRNKYIATSIIDPNLTRIYGFDVRPNKASVNFGDFYAIPSGIEYSPETSPIILDLQGKDDGTFAIIEK